MLGQSVVVRLFGDNLRYIWSINYKPFGSGAWFSEKQHALEAFLHGEHLVT